MTQPMIPVLTQVRLVSSGTISCLIGDSRSAVSRFNILDSSLCKVVDQIREDWVFFTMSRKSDFLTWQDAWRAFVAAGAPHGLFRVNLASRYRRLHDVLCKACLLTPGEAVSALSGFPSEAVANMGGCQKAIRFAFHSRHRYRRRSSVKVRDFDTESDLRSYLLELDNKGLLYHLDDSLDEIAWSVPVNQTLLSNLQTNHDRLWLLAEKMGIDPFEFLPASN